MITLRNARPEDSQRIWEITKDNWKQMYGYKQNPYRIKLIDIDKIDLTGRIRSTRDRILNDNERIYIVAVDSSDNVVGFICAIKSHDEHRIKSLYVDKYWHRNGIGSQLLKKAITFLGDEKPIILGVAKYNSKAIAFYRKNRFESVPSSEHFFEFTENNIVVLRIPIVDMVLQPNLIARVMNLLRR